MHIQGDNLHQSHLDRFQYVRIARDLDEVVISRQAKIGKLADGDQDMEMEGLGEDWTELVQTAGKSG